MIMGALKMVPPKIFLIVAFGDFHIFFRPNSDANHESKTLLRKLATDRNT